MKDTIGLVILGGTMLGSLGLIGLCGRRREEDLGGRPWLVRGLFRVARFWWALAVGAEAGWKRFREVEAELRTRLQTEGELR